MAYGLKYRSDYDSVTGKTYRIEIYQDGYTDIFYNIELSGQPVVQTWQQDDVFAPVRGCALTMKFLNSGNLPVESFYADQDNAFKVIHTCLTTGDVTFIGFINQADTFEDMLDYRHIITVTANDSLALLKDIKFNKTTWNVNEIYEIGSVTLAAPHGVIISDCNYTPVPYTQFVFIDANGNEHYYTPTVVTPGSGFVTCTVIETVVTTATQTGKIAVHSAFRFYERNNLLNIILVCLLNTGLELNCNVYTNLFEISFKTGLSFLQQTYIDTQTFLSGDNFDDCHTVLTKVLSRFGLCLFQAEGRWNIMRPNELRYYSNGQIPCFVYDKKMNLIGTETLSNPVGIGANENTFPETGATRYIVRPYKYSKETFNYKQPDELIRDNRLLKVGSLISSITQGDTRIDTYEIPTNIGWTHYYSDASRIVVKTNIYSETETDRYLLQPKVNNGGAGYLGFPNIEFNQIEVSKGDRLNFECSVKSASSTGGQNVKYRFGFYLRTTTGTYYNLVNTGGAGNAFQWNLVNATPIQSIGFAHTVLAAEAEQYYNYVLSDEGTQKKVPTFPADGLLTIRVYGTNDTNVSQPNVDCIIKDISISITNYINDSAKVIGQVHNNTQPPEIKNNSEIEILADDSPRNSIAGTLFRVQFTGLLQNKTTGWYRSGFTENKKLGEITTFENLFLHRVPHAKIEGTFYSKDGNSLNATPLIPLQHNVFTDSLFLFGQLSVDYRNDNFNCTMYEQKKGNETDASLVNTYSFTYLYDTK